MNCLKEWPFFRDTSLLFLLTLCALASWAPHHGEYSLKSPLAGVGFSTPILVGFSVGWSPPFPFLLQCRTPSSHIFVSFLSILCLAPRLPPLPRWGFPLRIFPVLCLFSLLFGRTQQLCRVAPLITYVLMTFKSGSDPQKNVYLRLAFQKPQPQHT